MHTHTRYVFAYIHPLCVQREQGRREMKRVKELKMSAFVIETRDWLFAKQNQFYILQHIDR